MPKFEINVDLTVEAPDERYANELVEALINDDSVLEVNRQKTTEIEDSDPREEPEYAREMETD